MTLKIIFPNKINQERKKHKINITTCQMPLFWISYYNPVDIYSNQIIKGAIYQACEGGTTPRKKQLYYLPPW